MKTLPADEHGVRMRAANFFFEQSLSDMPGQLEKMNEIEAEKEVLSSTFMIVSPSHTSLHRSKGSCTTRRW